VIAAAKSGWHRCSQLLLLHRNHHQRAEHTQRSERQRMRKHPDQDFRTDPAGGGGGGSLINGGTTGCWYLKIENPFCTGETGDSEGNEFGIANGPNRLFHFKMKSFPVVTATANPSAAQSCRHIAQSSTRPWILGTWALTCAAVSLDVLKKEDHCAMLWL
jgi:hypothetical protein